MTSVEIFRGATAAEYHGREMPVDGHPHIWVFEPAGPALVLGSTQNDNLVDHAAATSLRIEIARRRSGGGAVLLVPDESMWIDVLLPRRHHLWQDDIGTAPVWLGQSLAATLARSGSGGPGIRVHTGAMETSTWSALVCFAGRGPGEVFDADGAKIVGISQRRTREWARFQCAVSLRWNPETLTALLASPRPEVSDIASAGASIASTAEFDVGRLRDDLVRDLVDALEADDDSTTEMSPS